jgi:hypothetical protein
MNVPTVASTTSHTDPARPLFGYVASPRDFFIRAHDAMERSRWRRGNQAIWLADLVLAGETPSAHAIETYRKEVEREAYASAVYEVEGEKLDARRGLTDDDREMSYAQETAAAMGRA